MLKGTQADAVYQETIANLEDSVTKAKEEYDTTLTEISEYENAIANNTFYTDYNVEYLKNLYDDNLALLKRRLEEWGIEMSQIIGNSVMGGPGSSTNEYITVLTSLNS